MIRKERREYMFTLVRQWRTAGRSLSGSGIVVPVDCSCLMFSLGSSHRDYLYSGHCDMRKSFDGLCGLISGGLSRSATSGEKSIAFRK